MDTKNTKNIFESDLSLNLIVPIDEMDAVESVGRLTFEIYDDEVCVKNSESDAMWSVAPVSNIHGFVKAELEEELWANRPAELTNVSLLPLLLNE